MQNQYLFFFSPAPCPYYRLVHRTMYLYKHDVSRRPHIKNTLVKCSLTNKPTKPIQKNNNSSFYTIILCFTMQSIREEGILILPLHLGLKSIVFAHINWLNTWPGMSTQTVQKSFWRINLLPVPSLNRRFKLKTNEKQ